MGVVGAITPWNYPLHQIAAKVAYALGAGCTVVLKPSEVAPLDAFILAEVIEDAGLPAGRVQPGHAAPGPRSARPSPPTRASTWCRSPARPGPASGSPRSASQTLKRVALELGGKSANVLLDDLDDAGFERAVRDGIGKALHQLGPDLHRAHPHARPHQPAGRRRAHRGRRGRDQVPAQGPVRRGRHARPAVERGPGRAGHRLHPEGHRRGRQARHRRARAPRGRGPRAAATS